MGDEINSFVFFDLEGTGLTDNPRITEISLMAIHRLAIDDAAVAVTGISTDRSQYLPRVINKLTICMYPMKVISREAAAMTGLYNDSLINQKDFDHDLVSLLSSFLCRLEPPVCLISHNGFRFDFPLLKAELGSIGCDLPEGILCLDTWEMFRSLDGCPVPDTSHFLMTSRRTAVQSKKTHAASGIPLGSIKRKKKVETKSSADTEEEEMIPCVRQLFQEDETQANEFDAKCSQTVPHTANISSLSVNSETILVSECTAALPVVEAADALGNAVLAENTISKSQTCGLMATENCGSVVVESDCNVRLILNDLDTGHLALDCTVRANSESFLNNKIFCSVNSIEKTSAVDLGKSPVLSVSLSDKDENKVSSVLESNLVSVISGNGNSDDKGRTNDKPNLDNTTQILTCNVGISESVSAIELASLAVKSDAESCIFKSISNSLKEIGKECDIAEKEIANEEPSLNLMPTSNVPVISDSDSLLFPTTSQNFTNKTMVMQNRENDIVVKEYFNRHNRNNLPQKRFSYRLAEIHLRVVGCYPSGSHRAEDDCVALARIFMFTPNSTQWADGHAVPFSAFRPLYCSPHKHLQPGVFPSHLN